MDEYTQTLENIIRHITGLDAKEIYFHRGSPGIQYIVIPETQPLPEKEVKNKSKKFIPTRKMVVRTMVRMFRYTYDPKEKLLIVIDSTINEREK